MMTRVIIYSIIILMPLISNGQSNSPDYHSSIGIYGIGYKRYSIYGFGGILYDQRVKNKKHLQLSSSIDWRYRGWGKSPRFNQITITTGSSWDFKLKNFHLTPGIQIGYLYSQKFEEFYDYTSHGIGAMTKMDAYYQLNRVSVGLRCSLFGGGAKITTTQNNDFIQSGYAAVISLNYGISLRFHF